MQFAFELKYPAENAHFFYYDPLFYYLPFIMGITNNCQDKPYHFFVLSCNSRKCYSGASLNVLGIPIEKPELHKNNWKGIRDISVTPNKVTLSY